jgi:hypothetical protein
MIQKMAASILGVMALCSCDKKPEAPEVSPEVAALLRRVQQENGFDDDRLRKSLDQWVKVHEAVSEATRSGEITPDELKESILASKDAVKVISEQISLGEFMNVSLLDGLVSGKEAEMMDYLRREVVEAWQKAEDRKTNPMNAKLIEKVEALRKKDPALDEMIRAEAIEGDDR